MAKEIRENKKIYWVDEEGNKVRKTIIDKHIRKRDNIVENIFKEIEQVNKKLIQLKQSVRGEVTKFLDNTANLYSEKWQGNTTLYNFDKSLAIEVNISKKIAFDERLQIAKSKIDAYIETLAKNANKDLVLLINKAFRLDKKGNVDVKQILSLRSIQIKHPDWKEAINLIDSAIAIESSKTYYRFKKRNSEGKWEDVSLNFSNM